MGSTAYGSWVSYSGAARVWLALALVAVASVLAILAARLRRPLTARRPGWAVGAGLVLTWAISLVTFLFGAAAYVEQMVQRGLPVTAPANPITGVTFASAALTFAVVTVLGRGHGPMVALAGAAVAAMAAPMVFELPFDLVVMARTYPPIPPYPGLYRGVYFLPLFLVEISTLTLLTTSPLVTLTRRVVVPVALMFLDFAAWALIGFGYPDAPGPIAFNIAGKLLAFVATLALFLPPEAWRRLRATIAAERAEALA